MTQLALQPPEPEHPDHDVVLVVDDQEFVRRLVRGVLEQAGYQVVEAENGLRAVQYLETHQVDSVVMDVVMPELDGIRATEQIRKRDPILPVVLLTGAKDRESRVAGVRAGANDFLAKPFDKVELLARVGTLCKTKRLYDELEHERAKLQDELEATRQAVVASERMATLGSLAAGVGHEINNLAAVALCLSEALEHGIEPEDVVTCRSIADHLGSMGSQLMRLGLPRATGRISWEDVEDIVASTIALLKRACRLREAKATIEIVGQQRQVALDRVEMEQALINVIGNAADAIQGPGRITVTLDFSSSEELRLTVSDDGPGMPEDVLDKAFESYFTTKPPGRGTGLGLPVVKRIVHNWGGTVALDSTVGQGTDVTFQLPYEVAPVSTS